MKLAPIVLFVYNRPWHTRQTVEALQKNELAKDSELFVYCDGPRSEEENNAVCEVGEYAKTISGFKSVKVVQRDHNLGLAKSIIIGVTEIVNRYDRIIVLEDDLVSAPHFLNYMNDALEVYENQTRVMHISGYMFPINIDSIPETFFYRSPSCWGWATWSRAWKYFDRDIGYITNRFSRNQKKRFNLENAHDYWSQIEANEKGRIDTWAIFWYASVFLNNGLCLHPAQSLVQNIGHDGSGIHCGKTSLFTVQLNNSQITYFENKIEENIEVVNRLKRYFKGNTPSIFIKSAMKIRSYLLGD